MILDRYTQFSVFTIFEPRYHDKTVLLACRKVGQHNKVLFTEAPSMGVEPYYVSGGVVKKCKKASNGVIDCYAVPLDKLEKLELNERSHHEIS